MSISLRKTGFLVGLVFVSLFSLSCATCLIIQATDLEARIERHSNAEAKAYVDSARKAIERRCRPLPGPAEYQCVREEVEMARQGRDRQFDLEAQMSVAVWTRYMGIAAISGTAFGIVGVALVLLTFMEQRQTTRAELRAYLVLQPVEMEKELVIDEQPIKLVMPVENTGATPANEFCVHWAWRITNERPNSDLYDQYLGPYRTWAGEHSFGPRQVKRVQAEFNVDEMHRAQVLSGAMHLYFFGDIVYKDAFGEQRKTEFFYCYNPKLPNRMGQVSFRNRIG